MNPAISLPDTPVFPREIFLGIFKQLDPQSLGKVSQVCKAWKSYAEDETIWKFRLETDHSYSIESPASYRKIYQIRHKFLKSLKENRYKSTLMERKIAGQTRPFFYLEKACLFILEKETLQTISIAAGQVKSAAEGIAECAVSSNGRLLLRQTNGMHAIYDIASHSILFACDDNILCENGDYAAVHTKQREVEIRNIRNQEKVYVFPLRMEWILLRHTKDEILVFTDQSYLYVYDFLTQVSHKIFLENTPIEGVEIINREWIAVQTSHPKLLLFAVSSGKQIQELPYVLYRMHFMKNMHLPQSSFGQIVVYDPKSVQEEFAVYDTVSMQVKHVYDCSLYADYRVYLVHKRLIVLTNQPSYLQVFDLFTHQLLVQHDFGDSLLLYALPAYSPIEEGLSHNIFPFRESTPQTNRYGFLDLSSGDVHFPFPFQPKERDHHSLSQFSQGIFVDSSWKSVEMRLRIHDFTEDKGM